MLIMPEEQLVSKKRKILTNALIYIILAGVLICFGIFLYLFVSTIPNTCDLLCSDSNNGNLAERYNTIYIGLGTILTACTLCGTICAIIYQHKTILRASSLKIFSQTYNELQNESNFKKIFEYISSDSSGITKMTLKEMQESFIDWEENGKTIEITKFNAIEYFCQRLEYIGILVKNKYISASLLYPIGMKISNAYKHLNNSDFNKELQRDRYLHFRYLVYKIRTEEELFDDYCKNLNKEISGCQKMQTTRSF